MPEPRSPYPSDLSDAEWSLLEPLLESPERRGRPPKWPARRVADAVFYLLRSGCAWRMLPKEYPPWQTVYYHFWKWRRDGRLRQAHDRLREEVREAEGRERNPSGAVIDSQAVKGTGVGGPERGYDGAKRLSGRKRHLLVDTEGLVLGASVHAASLHDRDGARELLTDELKENLPRLELLWADGAYTRVGSAGGPKRSGDGGWRCLATATGNYGATGWKRSRAGLWFCRGGGWSRGPSHGSATPGGWRKITSDCRRMGWR
jgi:putative transposase